MGKRAVCLFLENYYLGVTRVTYVNESLFGIVIGCYENTLGLIKSLRLSEFVGIPFYLLTRSMKYVARSYPWNAN